MNSPFIIVALLSGGVFVYLTNGDHLPSLSATMALASAIITFPALAALTTGQKALRIPHISSIWCTALLLCHLIFQVLLTQLTDTHADPYRSTFFLALLIGLPLLGAHLFPFQDFWGSCLILFIWIPFDNRLTTTFWQWPDGSLGYPLAALMMVSLLTLIYLKIRPVKNLQSDFPFSVKGQDLLKVMATFALLAVVLIPIAVYTDFISFSPSGDWLRIPFIFFGIFLTIALPEELVFRGVIQNLIAKNHHVLIALILASVLFGMTHWNNGVQVWDWRYIGLATIAGIGYGLSYLWTRKLIVPVLVHTLVDTTWVVLFR